MNSIINILLNLFNILNNCKIKKLKNMKSLIFFTLLVISLCDNTKTVKELLLSHKLTKEGVASIMAFIDSMSGFKPDYLDEASQKRIGLSSTEYVKKTNDGTYSNFIKDNAKFGLIQWSFYSRKKALLKACKGKIADLKCQINYFVYELKNNYRGVYYTTTTSNNINDCCTKVYRTFFRDQKKKVDAKTFYTLCEKYKSN